LERPTGVAVPWSFGVGRDSGDGQPIR